jgi:hypothetical protein
VTDTIIAPGYRLQGGRIDSAHTEAQQKLAVATFDAQAVEHFNRAETLQGEGEAARRRLV